MKKRVLTVLLAAVMMMSTLAACGTVDDGAVSSSTTTESSTTEVAERPDDGQIDVALSLANAADYYIGTMVGAAVQGAFEEAGAVVQVLDGGNDVNNQINQIQNAVTSGVDILYVFPVGDGETYADTLKAAREAGVKVLMSNNYGGEGVADAYVGSDEFQMGAMMAAMVSEWADATYPDAGVGEVGVLIVESTFNETAIKRCLGMRLVGEKFLRKADTASIYYVKEEGEPVTYIDADGNEVAVDEPTGGLILDENGHAQLNPYYNEKVNIIEYSNRNSAGTDSIEAQNALENAVTMGETVHAVMSYGDTGAALETKVREMCEDGRIASDVADVAVFCSDLTDTNKDLILKSVDNTSVLRGVMAAGNLIGTLQEYAKLMVAGEELPEYKMEALSYITCNADGSDIVSVYYEDCPQLPATEVVFE